MRTRRWSRRCRSSRRPGRAASVSSRSRTWISSRAAARTSRAPAKSAAPRSRRSRRRAGSTGASASRSSRAKRKATMASRDYCTTAELGAADLGVIDGSWHLPNTCRYGAVEFRLGHIPGAVYFDIDTIADLSTPLPHMLPKPDVLAKEMTALGLGDGMRFVVYDFLGLYGAARVWWTLRAYGVEDVRILRGGLTKWIAEGRPLEHGEAHPKPRPFTPRLNETLVASLDQVRAALATGSAQVVDARPA